MDYVLDMAEIPTLQARQAGGFDAPALSRSIAAKLSLTVDGRRVTLRPVKHRLQFLPGAAGLRTTRLEVVLAGPQVGEQAAIRFDDEHVSGEARLERGRRLGDRRRRRRRRRAPRP